MLCCSCAGRSCVLHLRPHTCWQFVLRLFLICSLMRMRQSHTCRACPQGQRGKHLHQPNDRRLLLRKSSCLWHAVGWLSEAMPVTEAPTGTFLLPSCNSTRDGAATPSPCDVLLLWVISACMCWCVCTCVARFIFSFGALGLSLGTESVHVQGGQSCLLSCCLLTVVVQLANA